MAGTHARSMQPRRAASLSRSSPDMKRTPPAHTPGNQARLRGMTLQAKLEIGAVDDPLEREADAVADRVMGGTPAAPSLTSAPAALSRQCAECEDEKKPDPIRRKAVTGDGMAGHEAPPIVGDALSRPGAPLDAATRARMSTAIGHDFSGVRVHTDAAADASARAVGARAYTVGADVVFAQGRYAPTAPEGQRLLAHELAHVAQQGVAQQGGAAPTGDVVRRDGPDIPFKEAQVTTDTSALAGGLSTMADKLTNSDTVKAFGLALAEEFGGPLVKDMTKFDKIGLAIGGGALLANGLGPLLATREGRGHLAGVNFLAPAALIPYATLTGFTLDPVSPTEKFGMHLKFKADDWLKLAHDKLNTRDLTAEVDITMRVGADGKTTIPYASATIGILPGVKIAAGYGATGTLPSLGADAQPEIAFPQAGGPAPRGEAFVYVGVDLLQPGGLLPEALRTALGGAPKKKKK